MHDHAVLRMIIQDIALGNSVTIHNAMHHPQQSLRISAHSLIGGGMPFREIRNGMEDPGQSFISLMLGSPTNAITMQVRGHVKHAEGVPGWR